MITPARLKVLEAYEKHEKAGWPWGPTLRWLANECGISPATTTQHNNILYSHGYLRRIRQGQFPRNYLITRKGYDVLIRAAERQGE